MTIKTHNRFVNGQKVELPRHGGVAAKKWRQCVANSAVREPSTSFKTLSLPLELDLPSAQFEPSDRLYNAVEGFEEGSLGNLLIRAHLAGLSLFQNNGDAKSARQADRFPLGEFKKAMEDGMGLDIPRLTPLTVFNLFGSLPRGDAEYSKEAIANRLHSACFNRGMADDVDASLKDFLIAVGTAATQVASSYEELKANSLTALAEVGNELKKLSPIFPSLNITLREESIQTVFAYEGVVESVPEDADSSYLLHHIIACIKRKSPDLSAAKLQDELLSFSNNALSQIFGALLFNRNRTDGYLRAVEVDEFASYAGIPKERRGDVERFLKAAKTIPSPPFFNESHYANYRPAVAGKLRSWVSNYLTRLDVLDQQIAGMENSSLPPETGPEVDQILGGLDLSVDMLRRLLAERQEALNLAFTDLRVLKGEADSNPPYAAASSLEKHLKTISQIHGTFRSVLNQVNQRLEAVVTPDLEAWRKSLLVSESDAFALPKISGGTEPVDQSMQELNEGLRTYFDLLHRFSETVQAGNRGGFENVIANYRDQELARAKAVPNRTLDAQEAEELAKRRFLQSLYRLATRLSESTKEEVFKLCEPSLLGGGKKVFNRLKYNNQGRIYRSPWAPGRHQPLPVDWEAFAKTDWIEGVDRLCSESQGKLHHSPSGTTLQDYLEVKRFHSDLQILRLKEGVALSALETKLQLSELDIHPRLRIALREPVLSLSTLSSLTAWIGSQLSKFRFAARREKFIVRHKFSRVGQDDLLYVPKDKVWSPPKSYFQAKGSISEQLKEFSDGKDQLDSKTVFDQASSSPPIKMASMLCQLPHDWYLPLSFRDGLAEEVEGLPVGKDTVRRSANVRNKVRIQAAKIKGPSSYLTQFSQMLKGQTESGEWMLILDWVYSSSVVMRDGCPALAGKLLECRPRVAIPIKQLREEEDKFEFFDHLVAIDLGERKIGYAVFSIKDALKEDLPDVIVDPLDGEVAKGTIRIPGVRHLINAVSRHRGQQSANTKLRQNYDTKLEELRENVAGEIVQRIEALMARFHAFPVLESSVVNFQTGSRQLDLVYGDVVRHFAFSNVDAHKNLRKEHWMGGDRWEHPYLLAREYDENSGRRSGRAKPLSLFPGVTVHPAGTSQVCNVCARNALTTIRGLSGSIEVKSDGVVETPIGHIRLMAGSNYSEDEFKNARREKRSLPLNTPAKEGVLTEREAIGLARRSMRQKSPHQMSRDTTQSQFHCLFMDCDASYHADEGAAVNIGRKFLSERIDRDLTLQALQS